LESFQNAKVPSSGSAQHGPLIPAGRFLPYFLVTALFFLWGIPHNLNDILISQFMKSFEISRLQAGLVQSAFYIGYFTLALPAGRIMRRAGYKAGILTGLCLYATGCILLCSASLTGKYWFILTALFVIASGLAFLETGASPFVAQIGPAETAGQRLNLSQSFNPLGSITGVLIGSTFIFSGIDLTPAQIAAMQAQHTYQQYLRSEQLRVIVPYLVLTAVVLIWAALIARTPFPHMGMDFSSNTLERDHSLPLRKRRHFVFAVAAQFLYVGAQVGTWSYLIQYVEKYAGLAQRSAGYWLTGALAAFTVGRFFSTWLLRFVPAARLMGIYAIINTAITVVAVLRPGWIGVGCLIAASFFMSTMFPTIFALGIHGLGTRTKTGGAFIVMSIIGGAALTPLMGKIADTSSIANAYLVPAAGFVGVAIYAWFFTKPEPEEEATLATIEHTI